MDFSKLRDFMDFLCGWRIPGNACVVYYKRRPVFRYAAGYANLETGEEMQENALMYMYSATKPVTCAAALTLWEQGRFILNDPVKKYLPEWADVQVRDTAADGSWRLRAPVRDVTVQDLFTSVLPEKWPALLRQSLCFLTPVLRGVMVFLTTYWRLWWK